MGFCFPLSFVPTNKTGQEYTLNRAKPVSQTPPPPPQDIDDMEVAVEDGKVREWFHVPVDVEGTAEEDKKVKSEQDVADKSASPTTTEASTKFVSATATIQAAPQKSVVHAKVRANVVFPRSKTNHVEKSTLDEERKRKLTGL